MAIEGSNLPDPRSPSIHMSPWRCPLLRILLIQVDRLWRLICRQLAYLIPEKVPETLVNLYDRYSRQAFDKYYLKVAREIVDFCPNGRILDVGCGPGYLAIQVARLSKNTRIDGVDLSPKMVLLAINSAIEHGVEKRVKFVVGNGNALDCPEADYDMVVSTGLFHCLREPVRFLNECFRVLKPGGEAWIYDPAEITSGVHRLYRDLGRDWAEVVIFLGITLLAKIFRQGNLSRKDLFDIVNRSRFPEYSISVHGDTRLKLKKREAQRG
jgi:ubiquinone/menaquinone biosynthesis C-methylase UbiE